MTLSKEQLIQSALEYQASLRLRVRDGDDEEWTRESRLHIKLTEIALESLMRHPASYFGNAEAQEVAASLRELLERREQDKQEPVAWIVHARTGDQLTQDGGYVANAEGISGIHSTPLYAAPPSATISNSADIAIDEAELVSPPYKLVGEVVAWEHPTKERSVDFRWLNYDVAPGTQLYAILMESE